ncbi:MAG TPA: L,D-transpeptidase, partial [Gammaproteobacteria bacterium]|nr:L,D-transpeptidase [Gammaproteobacteria bacterium]
RILCKSDGYTCVKIKKHQSWENLFKDAEQRFLVMRLNRMNTPVYAGMTIAVPEDLEHVELMDLAPFPAEIKAPGKKVVIVNPRILAWGAYDADGDLIKWGPASLGSNWCPDLGHRCHSPVGTFKVYLKGAGSCKSTKFPLPKGGAPMPFCMFFKGGFALHGEPDGLPGDNVSHGCVRLFDSDAEWLNKNFVDIGTEVIIEPYGKFLPTLVNKNISRHSNFQNKIQAYIKSLLIKF